MPNSSSTMNQMKYTTNNKGQHQFEVHTQKPFAQFKDELNEGMSNSWASPIVWWRWEGQTCSFSTLGGDAEGKMEGDKVTFILRVKSFPATWTERRIVYEMRQKILEACRYNRSAEIETESKESLRQSALETYREAYCSEVEAGILIARWQAVDEGTKVLTALTSSGSAVAGWLVWSTGGWPQQVWRFLAATAAVLAITHVALKVSDRVKDWSDTKGHFVRLRTELETFLYHMKVNPNYSLDDFTAKFDALRTRFGEGIDRKKVDPLAVGIKKVAEAEADKRSEALRDRTASQRPAQALSPRESPQPENLHKRNV